MSLSTREVLTSKAPYMRVHAWTIWLLSAAFMFYKYVLEVSPSVMVDNLMGTFQMSATELGNLTASYFYAYLLLQIPAGLLLDRFGPRRTTTLAIVLCALGNLLFAWADTVWLAALGRFLTGAGAAFAAVYCLKLIANWFPARQFAFMAGLMMTMAMVGAVGGQAPLSAFIQQMDWRYALGCIGVAGLFLAVLFWVVVRDGTKEARRESSVREDIKQILRSPDSWWVSLYSGFAFTPVMVFGGLWGVSFMTTAFGLSQNLSARMVSLIFIGFAVGAPLFGWLSDWLQRRGVVMQWGTVAALLALSLLIYMPGLSLSAMALLLFLFGFSLSSFLLCFTMMREMHLPALAATGIGFMNAFDALLGAFADPLTGYILDLGWDGLLVEGVRVFSVTGYKTAFLTLPLCLVISLLLLLRVKETHPFSAEVNR